MKYLFLSLVLHPFLLYAQQAGTFKDPRDGQIYSSITIGNQTWMAENVRYNVPGSFLDSNQTNIKIGRLYNFEQVKKACPKGWYFILHGLDYYVIFIPNQISTLKIYLV
jgi:hypothetical protein